MEYKVHLEISSSIEIPKTETVLLILILKISPYTIHTSSYMLEVIVFVFILLQMLSMQEVAQQQRALILMSRCVCECARACVYMHAFVCVHVRACAYVCVHGCVYACICVCDVCTCMFICLSVCAACVAVAIYALSIMTFGFTQTAYLDVFLFNSHLNNGHYVLYCYRIYVGSINFELGEETVRNGFHQFGTIKAINMSWDGAAGKHKVFAYLVFLK